MKKIYSSPEIDIVHLQMSNDVLNVSDPESSLPEGGGGADPDPFADLFGP